MKTEFETFKHIGHYDIGNLKKNEPSALNFLSYKKQKITIEDVEESNEVYIERLEKLLKETNGFNSQRRIKDEIEMLKTR